MTQTWHEKAPKVLLSTIEACQTCLKKETEFDEVNEPKNLFRFLPVAITVFDSQAGRRSVLNKTLYASLASKVNTLGKML